MENANKDIDENFYMSLDRDEYKNSSIFNSIKFIDIHSNNFEDIYYFSLIRKRNYRCLGTACFGLDKENYMRNPLNGSFGGFDFSDVITFEIKEKFISLVVNYLNNKKPKNISITLSPDIYNLDNNSNLLSILLRQKFNIENIEVNQYIDVKNYILNNSVNTSNKKRIKKCINQGLFFKELIFKDYKEAYQIIELNRKRNFFKISMNWNQICEMIDIFRDKFIFFALFNNKKMVSSAICIKINPKILYVFYWGEIEGFEKLSPVSYMSTRLVDYCIKNKIDILDLGTSSQKSIPNLGLINFKRAIGARSCNKIKLKKFVDL